MEQKLYDLMDWAGIEELVYSEASNPHAMLGPHLTEDGLLIQALVPTAAEISEDFHHREEISHGAGGRGWFFRGPDTTQEQDALYPGGHL